MRVQIQRAAALALALAAFAAAAAARPAVAPKEDAAKGKTMRTLNVNAWIIKSTNYGSFVLPAGSQPGGFWKGPGYNYIYGAGMWIGALDGAGLPNVSMGYYPNDGSSEFGPTDPYPPYRWEDQAINKKARLYLSNDPADLAEWPYNDPSGKPIIKSIQDGYAVYSDFNPAFTRAGEQKVGVVVKQWSYSWNYADNNDIVFFRFWVINPTGQNYTNIYIGPCFDADIGDESGAAANDLTGFDYTKKMAIQYQTAGEAGWPRVGVFGCRYFESPRNNTGTTINVVDNQFAHPVLPDSALGMTAFKIFIITEDPSTDVDRYKLLTGRNHVSNVMDAYDEWGAVTAGDKRFVMSSGPFILAAGDSAATCVGVMCAWDQAAVYKVSDVAQDIYDNGFELAVPPEAPQITVIPEDKRVRITWTKVSETTPDPYWAKIDSTPKWYDYFPGSYSDTIPTFRRIYYVDTLLVDSFRIKTGATTSVAIRRGAANPSGGTDTVQAFFSQRALYARYDFQGYLVYRAQTKDELIDPTKREHLGVLRTGTSGASGYYIDRKDGYQIVRDLNQNIIFNPDGSVDTLKVFDTLGTDAGLCYTLVDSNVVNNFGYWYGVSAYDYQPNVFFTRKCPTTLASSPTQTAKFGAAQAVCPDYKPSAVSYTSGGGADLRGLDGDGTTNYGYELFVADPINVVDATYTARWSVRKEGSGTGVTRLPVYSAKIYDGLNNLQDSILLRPTFGLYGASDPGNSFYGSSSDQGLFGGVVFRPFMVWKPWLAKADTMATITESSTGSRTYPADSVRVRLDPNTFKIDVAQWMWRGSDYEIRWKDTVVNVGVDTAALTCQIWDVTNNIEVPFEGGLAKANMTKPGWCFNYLPNTSGTVPYIYNRANTDNTALFISGVTVYLNKKGTVTRRLDWPNRPETGDVWRINCSGPRPPVDGNTVSFVTTAPGRAGTLSASMLDNVRVVPNPYLVRAGWDVTLDYPNLYFTNLPSKCTIRIYNLAGDLIQVIKHETTFSANNSSAKWNLLTPYNKRVASGMYIYHVDAPGIGTKTGKFAVIK